MLIAPALVLTAGADAASPFVDAGVSARVAPGEPFALEGHVEDFSFSPSSQWIAPEGCSVADAASLVTSASCASSGPKVFTLTATAGAQTASDTVSIAITGASRTLLASAQGTTTVGAKGVELPGSAPTPFVVPEGAGQLLATVSVASGTDTYKITLEHGERRWSKVASGTFTYKISQPPGGDWTIAVQADVARFNGWTATVEAISTSDATLPAVRAPSWAGEPGALARLVASVKGSGPLHVAWETDPASRRFDDGIGSQVDVPFSAPTTARVKVTDAQGYEVVEQVELLAAGSLARPLTVVAVIDNAFSVYHNDFLGPKHPWNLDADPHNDLDFSLHPAAYVAGFPAAKPLFPTLPSSNEDDSNLLRTSDASMWASMESSHSAEAYLYWVPGTKVIGALRFGSSFPGANGAHGTASASVAAGNVHGSCPECLVVLVAGPTPEALAWVASQPWIDVVTNSYGHGGPLQIATLGLTRDNMYFHSPIAATKAASEDGQVIVFSAGNGFVNAFDAPMFTYWSSEKGPDWMVTVGAVAAESKQTVSGAGKPVDISSIGERYPSSGGSTPDGKGTHGGTSNAAPVTAGYFAKVLQRSREILGDASVGHAGGVVASGTPVDCGPAWSECPLGDGILTRAELQDLVFKNVLPSPQDASDAVHVPPLIGIPFVTWPTTEHAYYYQGHGVLSGRIDGAAKYESEWTRMVDAAVGVVAPFERPAGEVEWFTVDSKCRQRVWGAWSGGYYRGATPALDPRADPIAFAFNEWCDRAPANVGPTAASTVPNV